MEKKGLLIKGYFPKKLKVEIEQLNGDRWQLHYTESFDKEIPKEALETSIRLAEDAGIKIRKRKNALSYTVEGGTNATFGALLGELLAITEFGDLTLREMFMLSGMGAKSLRDLYEKRR